MARPRAEIGAIGLPLYAGRLSLDTNARLRWPFAGRIYRAMMDDEPAVGALRTAVFTLLRTDLQVQPGGPEEADAQAAELIERALLEMDIPIGTAIRQIAAAYFYGFSLNEIVYRRMADGRVGWKYWALRRQESFYRWVTDPATGAIVAFQQRPAPTFTLREIPLTKCIHVVADDSEGSPEGRGVLRTMYRYWYMVTQFELLFGIALERFGTGLPVFERVDQTVLLTQEQEDNVLAQAEALRQNEQAGLLLPWGLKFSFADSPGLDAQTYLGAIQAYRTWMLTTGLAEFIALGTGETGSRALGSSKIDLFLKALTGLQDRICEAINRQAIPRLLRANGITAAAPTVSLPPVREYDVKAIADFLEVAGRAGVFHPTPEDEQWLRKVSDAPDLDLERIEALFGEAEAQAAADAAALARQQQAPDDDEGGPEPVSARDEGKPVAADDTETGDDERVLPEEDD